MYEFKEQYKIDFSAVKYYLDMHKVIQDALDFPDYYGQNWDAFWDCLTVLVGRPVHIEMIGLEVIKQKFAGEEKTLLEILKEFKHYQNDKYAHEIEIKYTLDGKQYEIE